MNLIKAHAYGNDFLLLENRELDDMPDRATLTRAVCDRHRGLGADGLIAFKLEGESRARMALLNADGSYSEVSGNGVRCLAAWMAMEGDLSIGAAIEVDTDAGTKRLELLERTDAEFTFRAAMGAPEDVRMARIDVNGTAIDAATLRVGNPQCVVLGDVTVERLRGLAASLAVHPHFPAGTNVELAAVEAPDRVRILIWERGVGPTESSGTGACAAAVAAIAFGGAARSLDVVSPGGVQHVEWRDEGLFLTGSAQVLAVCSWYGRRAPGA
ncbi:MAG: diaminopimelate epimerase [Acidobacteria bacterium]|nr:diaminopimelate epimerase [Acidobacteriota bacterium]